MGVEESLGNLEVKGTGFARWQPCAARYDKCIE